MWLTPPNPSNTAVIVTLSVTPSHSPVNVTNCTSISSLLPVKFATVKKGILGFVKSKVPGKTPPTYWDADNIFPKKSIEDDVKFTEPVNKVFSILKVITVGGIGCEPESNWKYNDDGFKSSFF